MNSFKKEDLLKKFSEIIKNINNLNILIEQKNIFTKNYISPLYAELKTLGNDEKKSFGKEINDLKNKIDEIYNNQVNTINFNKINNIKSEYDLLIPSDYLKSGSLTPIQIVANQIIEFFNKLNFDIVYDSEISSVKYNFDNLNIKESHPARSMSDTFYIDNNKLLRVHCTSVTAKKIEEFSDLNEIKVVSFGNVYRKDDDDATHSHQFNQIDFVWIKKDISISNLKWLIDSLLKHLFNQKINTRYRVSQFPFTEPSMEVDISCFNCNSKGCHICKNTGWIEILGCGMLHPNVLKASNINSNNKFGIAAGFGLDRIAMLKYGISDIRHIYNNDFRLLNQFRGKN